MATFKRAADTVRDPQAATEYIERLEAEVDNLHNQVAALVGALERRTPDNPYESGGTCAFCGSYDNHYPSCSWQQACTLLANLPAEALETARKAQAHDEMKAEKKRLRELVESAIPRLCEGCYLKWPYSYKSYEPVDDGIDGAVRGVGEGDSHAHPRGGVVECAAARWRAALAEREPE